MKYIKIQFFVLLFTSSFVYAQTECYQLVWSDEFDYVGKPDPAKWGYDIGGNGWGNGEAQYYTDRLDNSFVENGVLTIVAKKETYNGSAYTSARLITKNKGDWKYGRVEVMAKIPQGRGSWSAIWMLPTDWSYGGWPESGEIDIMEHVGYDPNRIQGTIHTEAFNHSIGTQKGASKVISSSQTAFHLYAIEWFEDRIDFYIDDSKYFTFNNENATSAEWPFDERFHLLLNIAIGGSWGGVQGIDDTIFPTSMEVDYVRVYQYYENLDIIGKKIVETNETALTYETTFFDNVSYNWTVPEGVQIVKGQGTNQIDVNWNDVSGSVSVSIDPGSGCDPTVLDADVVVPITPQEDIYILDDFEAELSGRWTTSSEDIVLSSEEGNLDVSYKIVGSASFQYEFESPLNLEHHGILKFPFKLKGDAVNNPDISITLEDYLGNQTLANFFTFKPAKEGQYHIYSFDYYQLWGIVNPIVNGQAITKLNFTLNFGNSGFTIPEILLYRSDLVPQIPQDFNVELVQDSEYKLSWTDVGHAFAYNLYQSKNEDGPFVKIENKIPSGDNPTILNLKNEYFYKLAATNNYGESELTVARGASTITGLFDGKQSEKFKVFPNPVINNTFKTYAGNEMYQIFMYDINGRKIELNTERDHDGFNISIRQKVNPGLYLIRFIDQSGEHNKVVMVN